METEENNKKNLKLIESGFWGRSLNPAFYYYRY